MLVRSATIATALRRARSKPNRPQGHSRVPRDTLARVASRVAYGFVERVSHLGRRTASPKRTIMSAGLDPGRAYARLM